MGDCFKNCRQFPETLQIPGQNEPELIIQCEYTFSAVISRDLDIWILIIPFFSFFSPGLIHLTKKWRYYRVFCGSAPRGPLSNSKGPGHGRWSSHDKRRLSVRVSPWFSEISKNLPRHYLRLTLPAKRGCGAFDQQLGSHKASQKDSGKQRCLWTEIAMCIDVKFYNSARVHFSAS